MMTANQIRSTFLNFFKEKGHQVVSSAPIVNRQDPTLMFTNAGMNPFKDFFLGNQVAPFSRVADTQKCLRVSGKHNDLEEVGVDSYHHTMFEMLGNWSFGDYFKEEAIQWAWELLTEVYKIDKQRLYVTIFEGDPADQLEKDNESLEIWKKWIAPNRILACSKKDNFWEMGDAGPCGPCSEIHVDLRSEEERNQIDGLTLVNNDHPQVVEIWNLVFIQYNRKADGTLEALPARHVDTGMGFERLTMALQGKTSNYDTDIFSPFISKLSELSGVPYTSLYHENARSDMAMRVIADHLRAVSFTIADGELPSANGAGYVIRRILRRAVRYGYSFLGFKSPFIYKLVPLLADQMREVFPELDEQRDFVAKVIMEEERSFLRTLEGGLKRLDNVELKEGLLDGKTAFELYDTFGFPIDLTRLIAKEKGFSIDEQAFELSLHEQKARSRQAAGKTSGDWVTLQDGLNEVLFKGYDHLEIPDASIIKYREIENRKGHFYQLVLNQTPFYPEGGGQVGDRGILDNGQEQIEVIDTVKENDLIIHLTEKLPQYPDLPFVAKVDATRRLLTENNHSATHLLHAALRQVLGTHVHQKGSMLNDQYLRFDFSHIQKISDRELLEIELIVNQRIRENIIREEARNLPLEEAKAAGAMMLFGEKYGDHVRMITFDPSFSRELCGGCHVRATGQIGFFKILSESAVAAGVRRIEAITSLAAEKYFHQIEQDIQESRNLLKSQVRLPDAIGQLLEENRQLRKEIETLQQAQAMGMKTALLDKVVLKDGVKFLISPVSVDNPKVVKDLIYSLEQSMESGVLILGNITQDKPMLSVMISKPLAEAGTFHAGNIVRELAPYIDGGGGGQPFYASAGGKNPEGLEKAMAHARQMMGLA
jgi:alanyl-tRNA synthetase